MSTKPDAVRAALAELDKAERGSSFEQVYHQTRAVVAAVRAALAEQPAEPSQGWQAEALMLREQLHQERNTNELLRSQNDKDYWAWQGDGTDHLESMGNRMIVCIFASDLRHLLATSHPAPSVAVPEGCACRWDADDKRVQTCERHQGWLDVIAEWADRARAAEAALAASPQPPTQQEGS